MSQTASQGNQELQKWQMKVRSAQFHLELSQRRQTRIHEIVQRHKYMTPHIIKLIKENKMDQVFEIMIEMNYNLTNQTQSLDEAHTISSNFTNTIYTGAGDLASKDKKWGEGRTPEMSAFFQKLHEHKHLYNEESWREYEQYRDNYKKQNPNATK